MMGPSVLHINSFYARSGFYINLYKDRERLTTPMFMLVLSLGNWSALPIRISKARRMFRDSSDDEKVLFDVKGLYAVE